MAHELEFVDGTAAFLGRQDAWHHLGQVIGDAFDIDTMQERCPQLVMPVRLEPTYVRLDGKYVETPATQAVVREDGKVVGEGVTKDSYQIVQQRDIFEWGAKVADLGDFPFVSAGLLNDGGRFFATLDAGGFGTAGLRVNTHLTVVGSHDRSLAVGALYSHVVVVCSNTWAAAARTADDRITIRHTTNVDEMMESALMAIEGAKAFQKAEHQALEALAKRKLTARAFDLALDGVLPSLDEEARGAEKREQARQVIRDIGRSVNVADAKGTALGFVQAVNTYENWYSPIRGRTNPTKRAEAQFKGIVGGQPLTRKALVAVR